MAEIFTLARAFRGARDAWWTQRKTVLPVSALEDPGRLARQAARKEQRWSLSGRRYLRAYQGLHGRLIGFPPELLAHTERLIEDIAPRLGQAFDRRISALAFDAWRSWPVATGLSKSLLDVEFEQRDTRFVGRLVSRAPYSVFIRRGTTLQQLVRAPGREVARGIAQDLARREP